MSHAPYLCWNKISCKCSDWYVTVSSLFVLPWIMILRQILFDCGQWCSSFSKVMRVLSSFSSHRVQWTCFKLTCLKSYYLFDRYMVSNHLVATGFLTKLKSNLQSLLLFFDHQTATRLPSVFRILQWWPVCLRCLIWVEMESKTLSLS